MNIFEDISSTMTRERPLRVALLGCTGSIGKQTLDVVRMHPDKLRLTALAVNSSCRGLVDAAREFGAAHVAVADESRRNDPILDELPEGCELGFGRDAVTRLTSLPDVDCVLVAVVGEAGIWASYEALRAGKIWHRPTRRPSSSAATSSCRWQSLGASCPLTQSTTPSTSASLASAGMT